MNRFHASVAEVRRKNPEQVESEVTLAIGLLLGVEMPGCAAAVAVLFERAVGRKLDSDFIPEAQS